MDDGEDPHRFVGDGVDDEIPGPRDGQFAGLGEPPRPAKAGEARQPVNRRADALSDCLSGARVIRADVRPQLPKIG